MFRWLRRLFRRLKPVETCSLYNEHTHTCSLECMEKIHQNKYRDEKTAWNFDDSFSEFD